ILRLSLGLEKDRNDNAQDERRVFRVRSIRLLCLFFDDSRAAYRASGAISTPFGQASVPASMKNFLKNFGFLRGSKTGPVNHWETSMCFSLPSSNRVETINSRI